MTAVAGWVADNGDVWLGADSASSGGTAQEIWRTPKVFVLGPVGFAYAGSWRFGQLVQHRLAVPPLPKRARDLDRWMAIDLVDAIRTCLIDGGWLKRENERSEGGVCLVAARGRLFIMQQDFSVGEVRARFAAHGNGRDVVYGALHATAKLKWSPQRRLRVALTAAAAFSSVVAPPFLMVRVPRG